MAAVQPVLQRMTPAEKARFVKECNAKGVKGKTAKGVVKGVDKGRGKAGYVSAVVVAVVALVGVGAYVWRRINTNGEPLPESDGMGLGQRLPTTPLSNSFITSRTRTSSPAQIENEDTYPQDSIDRGIDICKEKRFTDNNKRRRGAACRNQTGKLRREYVWGHCSFKESKSTEHCTYVPPTPDEILRRRREQETHIYDSPFLNPGPSSPVEEQEYRQIVKRVTRENKIYDIQRREQQNLESRLENIATNNYPPRARL